MKIFDSVFDVDGVFDKDQLVILFLYGRYPLCSYNASNENGKKELCIFVDYKTCVKPKNDLDARKIFAKECNIEKNETIKLVLNSLKAKYGKSKKISKNLDSILDNWDYDSYSIKFGGQMIFENYNVTHSYPNFTLEWSNDDKTILMGDYDEIKTLKGESFIYNDYSARNLPVFLFISKSLFQRKSDEIERRNHIIKSARDSQAIIDKDKF